MIFNVRTPETDPHTVLHTVDRVELDLAAEKACEYRRPLQVAGRWCGKGASVAYGPFTRQLIALVAQLEGHYNFGVTVRKARLAQGMKPAMLKHWHTDFAHNRTLEQCMAVRNYLFVSAEPGTRFLEDANVELANANAISSSLPTFQIKPWTLIRYNATEIHTSVNAESTGGWRYFFRATVDQRKR